MVNDLVVARAVEALRRIARVEPGQDPLASPAHAASAFINAAGARVLRVCPKCFGDIPTPHDFIIMVPVQNDGQEFREALRVLHLDHLAVVPRQYPLADMPAVCAHRRGEA